MANQEAWDALVEVAGMFLARENSLENEAGTFWLVKYPTTTQLLGSKDVDTDELSSTSSQGSRTPTTPGSPSEHAETNYWPVIQNHILDGGPPAPSPRPAVVCELCKDSKLAIDGLEPPAPGAEVCIVLPCGHVFGACCLQLYLNQCWRDAHFAPSPARHRHAPPACPSCRLPLSYRRCPHPVTGCIAPLCGAGRRAEDVRVLPPGAAAAEPPDMCESCRACSGPADRLQAGAGQEAAEGPVWTDPALCFELDCSRRNSEQVLREVYGE